MEQVVQEAERTGKLVVEQVFVPRLPKTLTCGPLVARLRHLKLWYCMITDDALPPTLFVPHKTRPSKDTTGCGEDPDESLERPATLTEEPQGLGASLASVHLGCNLLTRVPPGIETLAHLRELILDGNNIKDLPRSFLQLKQLSILVLSYNKLTSLPEGFWSAFPELTYLSLHHNQLCSIGRNIYDLAPQLEVLYLHYNMITHIESPPPGSATTFATLRSLSLSHNQLSTLPAEFVSRLVGLRLLFLENNKIEFLPETICDLVSLELLRIDSNRVEFLPDKLSHMDNLIALDCDHNRITSLPDNMAALRRKNLRVLRARGNPLHPESLHKLSECEISYCDIYCDEWPPAGVQRTSLSVPILLRSLVTVEQISAELEFRGLQYDDDSTLVSQLCVYRQWDSGTCGYHALKNAVISVLAYLHKAQHEEISESVLRLTCSGIHFWVPFFHWQGLLLQKGERVRAKAQQNGRKYDMVWAEVNIKHGVMERLYIDYLLRHDPIIRSIGRKHFVVISDLDYISNDPFDTATIIELDRKLSSDMEGGPPVRAFIIGVSKSHFISVIAYHDKRQQQKYLIANSSDYEDPSTTPAFANDENDTESTERFTLTRSLEPNVRMIIDCVTCEAFTTWKEAENLIMVDAAVIRRYRGRDSFRSYYLQRIVEGFVRQSYLTLLDWNSNEVDPTKIQDWLLSATTFFASFFSKVLQLGPHHVKQRTKDSIRDYCRKLGRDNQIKQHLMHIFTASPQGFAAAFEGTSLSDFFSARACI